MPNFVASPVTTTTTSGVTKSVAPTTDQGFPWVVIVLGLVIAAAIAGAVTWALSRRARGAQANGTAKSQ